MSTSSNALYTTTNALIKSITDIQISAGDDVGSNWVFGGDGVLTLPGGNTRIGNVFGTDAIVGNTGTSVGVLVQGQGGAGGIQWFDNPDLIGSTSTQVQVAAVVVNSPLASTTGTVQIVTGVSTTSTVGSNTWEFGADGNLTIPDDIQDANGSVVRVATTSTAPTRVDGQLWFNTLEGRLYIKYSDAWVDAAPLMMPAPDTDIDVASITFPDASVQTTAWTGDSGSSWQLTSSTSVVSLDSNGDLTLPGGQQIGGSDSTRGIALTTDRGTILFGNVPEVGPTGSSHFHIMKDSSSTDLFFGDDYNYVKLPTAQGVEVGANGSVWTFGTDGLLELPNGGTISAGMGAIRLEPANASSSTQALLIYPTVQDGNHIHLTAGGGETDLYLGSDIQYVKVDHSGAIVVGTVGANTSTWTFGTDGNLTLPLDSSIQTIGDLGTARLRWLPTGGGPSTSTSVYVSSTGVSIETDAPGNENTWVFGTDGGLTFPDTTVQTTAYTGAVSTSTLVNGTATVSLSSTGALTLPDGGTLRMSTAPTSSTGAAGDKAGTIAVNSGSIFYCIADYYLDTGTYYVTTTNSNDGSVFFIEIAKGSYPQPQIGWGVSIGGNITQIDGVTTDLGSSWRISVGAVTAYSTGTNVTLTNPSPSQSNIWVKQAWGTTGSW